MANEFVTMNPYDDQLEKLRQRQRMVDLLQQQALQPLESQVAPGGYAVRTSPVLGLAKMLQAYMGGKEQRNIDKEMSGIRDETASAAAGITGRLFGEKPTAAPIGSEPYTPPALTTDEMGNTPRAPKPITLQPDQAASGSRNRSLAQSISEGDQLNEIKPTGKYIYDPADALQIAMTPAGARAMQGNPALAAMLAQTMKPKEPEKFGTEPRYDQLGRAFILGEGGNVKYLNGISAQPKTAEEPSSVREYEYAKNKGYKGSFEDWQMNQRRASATNVNVDTGASKELVGNFANELKDSHKSAIASAKILPQLDQLDKLTQQGTYTGAMAPNAVGASEFLQSFGINVKPEVLANTKTFEAIKNNLVLQMMAANGGARGFSKEETAILDNAFPQIVNSAAARKAIVQLFRNQANAAVDQYNQQLGDFKTAYPKAVVPYQPIETDETRYRRYKAEKGIK
jgi:hypothetical protein